MATVRNELFKPKAPEYTVRMLLAKTTAEHKEVPQLKEFSHFTLGCTYADETAKVTLALEKLSELFKDTVTFDAEAAVNLGSENQPLWAVSLNLGKDEEVIRAFFSAQFDPIMCPERNGILYQWQYKEGASKKCPHITLGPRKEDEATAKKLVELKCKFIFDRIDYKRVGPHDPHISKVLEKIREKDFSNLKIN